MTEDEKALLLAEYQPLREEVNRTIDRMTYNEVLCVGAFFSLVLFQLNIPIESNVPQEPLSLFALALSVAVAFLGEGRSKIFRRHLDQVDDYLAALEARFCDQGGWTNHYRRTIALHDARQMGTRAVLWHVMRFTALGNAALQIGYLLG